MQVNGHTRNTREQSGKHTNTHLCLWGRPQKGINRAATNWPAGSHAPPTTFACGQRFANTLAAHIRQRVAIKGEKISGPVRTTVTVTTRPPKTTTTTTMTTMTPLDEEEVIIGTCAYPVIISRASAHSRNLCMRRPARAQRERRNVYASALHRVHF